VQTWRGAGEVYSAAADMRCAATRIILSKANPEATSSRLNVRAAAAVAAIPIGGIIGIVVGVLLLLLLCCCGAGLAFYLCGGRGAARKDEEEAAGEESCWEACAACCLFVCCCGRGAGRLAAGGREGEEGEGEDWSEQPLIKAQELLHKEAVTEELEHTGRTKDDALGDCCAQWKPCLKPSQIRRRRTPPSRCL
jgi:hypothetical protein